MYVSLTQNGAKKHKNWGIGNFSYRIKLNYEFVQNILDLNDNELTSIINFYLSPGRGLLTIQAEDIDTAIQGLESQHSIIRLHATFALCETKLLNKDKEKIIPCLIRKLNDENVEVRRFAKLSVESWSKHLKKFRKNLEILKTGSDAEVDSLIDNIIDSIK